MTTFSADREPEERRAATSALPAGFLAIDRRALVRLSVAVLLGVAALVAPVVVPAVGRTGAVFTDKASSTVTLTTAPTFAATTAPAPSASPTGTAPAASPSDPPPALLPAAQLGKPHAPRNPRATSRTP